MCHGLQPCEPSSTNPARLLTASAVPSACRSHCCRGPQAGCCQVRSMPLCNWLISQDLPHEGGGTQSHQPQGSRLPESVLGGGGGSVLPLAATLRAKGQVFTFVCKPEEWKRVTCSHASPTSPLSLLWPMPGALCRAEMISSTVSQTLFPNLLSDSDLR